MMFPRLYRFILGVGVPLSLIISSSPRAAAQTTTPTGFEPPERNFPAQYVTKLYTEALGRAPDQAAWRNLINYYSTVGCNIPSLQAWGKAVLTSPEFTELNYDASTRILVTYRAVLNRDPSNLEIATARNWLNQGNTFAQFVDQVYVLPEFGALSSRICDVNNPGYQFGNTPPPTLAVNSTGFAGSETALQAQLDRALPGSTVYLASRALIPLSQALRVPPGVTLATTDTPRPNEYANMARLVRAGDWPGATVDLQPGARLISVWVDGQRGTVPQRYARPNVNIRMLSGNGTSVIFSRISNTRGATSVEAFGTNAGQFCAQNLVWGNLITAYTSNHTNGEWSDGISATCEDTTIAYNTVVDSTDVALIIFNVNPIESSGIKQTSQIFQNTVIQAGNSGYGGLAIDPFFNVNGGSPPGKARFSFDTAAFYDNLLWTSQRVHLDIAIAAGTRPWFGTQSYTGSGGIFQRNTSGNLSITAGSGIVVSGLLNTQITDNVLWLRLIDVRAANAEPQSFFDRITSIFRRRRPNPCQPGNIIAAVEQGYASGTIQSPYDDRSYDRCIQMGL